MIPKIFLTIVGLMYAALAVWCSFWPKITSQKVGFDQQPGVGQSEYLVIYGGLELGMALVFLAPLVRHEFLEASLWACLLMHACLVAFRSVSLFLYRDLAPITYQLAIGEWIILLLTIVCLAFYYRTV